VSPFLVRGGRECRKREYFTTELYTRVRTQIKRARRWCVMGCPSFYHEIGDCDVMYGCKWESGKRKLNKYRNLMTRRKKKRNARIGKKSLLSLNVEKMLFFLWKNKTSRTYCRETTLSMSKRSISLQDVFLAPWEINLMPSARPYKGAHLDTCQKSKSIKVFCYIRFGPMLKTFFYERKFGRFWDGKFKCCEYETGIKGVCGG